VKPCKKRLMGILHKLLGYYIEADRRQYERHGHTVVFEA